MNGKMWMCVIALSMGSVAKAENPAALWVTVVSVSGEAIGTASVRFDRENTRHRVNGESGAWTSPGLYTEPGKLTAFARGDVWDFEVSAPGYRPLRLRYQIRKRNNRVPVVLEPMVTPDRNIEQAVAGWDAYLDWWDAELAHQAHPSSATSDDALAARSRCGEQAIRWLAELGDRDPYVDLVRGICRSSADDTDACE